MHAILYGACVTSVFIILSCIICVIASYILKETIHLKLGLTVFGGLFGGSWVIACLCLILQKTVIVTANEISVSRWEKVKWSIQKEQIIECIYTKVSWYACFFPISTINAYALQFKLLGKGISRKSCSLSYKQVKTIQEKFGYPVRVVSSIYEQ